MTEVAASNPHAWFPVRRGPDELVTPSAGNRLVGWPYTKYSTCTAASPPPCASGAMRSASTRSIPAGHGVLPYAGGPASDYVLHSVASMAGRLREGPARYGLVSGVGMHMTKHVYAVWSSEPGPLRAGGRVGGDPPHRPVAETYEGPATVAAYTVAHGRVNTARRVGGGLSAPSARSRMMWGTRGRGVSAEVWAP